MAAAPDDPRAGLPAHRAAGFDRLLGIVAAATLFFIMALTCADVAGRYFFGAPIPGGFEITELAMGALIFTGLPLATLRGQQVTVDLFDAAVPRALRAGRDFAIHLLAAGCLGALAWRLWVKAGQMVASGDTTATLHIPVPPLVYYMSMQAAVTAVVLLALALVRETPRQA